MSAIATRVGRLLLANPIMPASGTFEYDPLRPPPFDVNRLGALVPKSITLAPQPGNPPSRLAETPSGLINSIGIPSPGLEAFLQKAPGLYAHLTVPVIVSVAGYSAQEYADLTRAVAALPFVAGVELNLSCPNLETQRMPAQDPELLRECVAAARGATEKPIWAKLAPNVASLVEMAAIAKAAGADAVTLINALRSTAIDVERRHVLLGHETGGLSGPAILPVALAAVWDVARAVNIPVVGVGGIMTVEDVVRFMLAGASAVQVGTATFRRPTTMMRLIEALPGYLQRLGVEDVTALVGTARAGEAHYA